MAILEMDKFTLYGLHSERKRLIEALHRMELVQIDSTDTEALSLEKIETTKKISGFDSYLASSVQALEISGRYHPKKSGMFSKRIELSDEHYAMDSSEANKMMKIIYEIIRLDKTIAEKQDGIIKLEMKQSFLLPYLSLDVPMNLSQTQSTRIQTGILEGEWSAEQLTVALQKEELYACHFEILHTSKQQTCLWFVYPKSAETECKAFLRKINLQEPGFSLSHHAPKKKYELLEKEISELQQEIANCEEKLKELSNNQAQIELFYDHLLLRKEKYEMLSRIGITENTFIMQGYLPRKQSGAFKKELEQNFSVAVEIEAPEPGEDVPVSFTNNAFVEPVEGITSDYSLPSPNDIDPNPIMAFFYYFFFGMMFSDAGYGLLMMIGCGVLAFSNLMEPKKRRPFKMFFLCGVSTTIWGILYGSFFGDMIATVSRTFGSGQLAFKPILMDPVAKPLELLILSVSFGLIHILFALGIKFYMLWHQGDKKGAIFDVGFWMIVLSGAAIMAAGMGFGIDPIFNIGVGMMVFGAVGLVLTQGRAQKNIIGKLFGGILSLYDITSYVGDILSYSRLMALGLATGVIASVINVLGSLGGGGIVGLISYIAISIFGHALNFAINMLGAYVHTNRLQYVEFYQKFYEGGGRKFEPFSMNTKYYQITKNKKKEGI